MASESLLLPPSLAYAQALLAQLIAQGVREVVLCPGSRSAPFAYALVQAERAGLVRTHVRIDERTAGFLALGLGKADPHRPAVVITTSGTAVANLHPAVLEARHSNVPLIVLSADRPHELRGTGANQTTTQVGIFAQATRLVVDVSVPHGDSWEQTDARAVAARAVAHAVGLTGAAGPVHVNVGLRDPLAPDAQQLAEIGRRFETPAQPVDLVNVARVTGSQDLTPAMPLGLSRVIGAYARTVVIAGDSSDVRAAEVARAHGWPLIAEPTSGVIGQDNVLAHGAFLLGVSKTAVPLDVLETLAVKPSHILEGADTPDTDMGGEERPETENQDTQFVRTVHDLVDSVEQVLVFGRPTLTRPVQKLIARKNVHTVVFAHPGTEWVDASRTADAVVYGVPTELTEPARTPTDSTWLNLWHRASSEVSEAFTDTLRSHSDLGSGFAPMLAVTELASATQDGDALVLASSSAVRDADLYVSRWNQNATVLAHRGLAGIDGTISFAMGIALSRISERTRLLIGDLAFMHDSGALLRGPQEPDVNLDIVVLNDNGGAIFGSLEHASAGDKTLFERVFGTPHVSDIASLSKGFGVLHSAPRTVEELRDALEHPVSGVRVIEISFPRTERSSAHSELCASLFTNAKI